MKPNIFDICEILISKGLPFALYQLPGDNSFTLIFQKSYDLSKIDIINIEDKKGFIIAAFDSAKTGMANLIAPDFVMDQNSIPDNAINFLDNLPDKQYPLFHSNTETSKNNYFDTATYLIEKLQAEELKKVILSRVINKKLNHKISIKSLLTSMANKYNHAFINLFCIPDEGIWFGASPEALFTINDEYVFTDALAGTKPVIEDKEVLWTYKEKEEQYLVTQFIESLLSELGITDYQQNGPITKKAGNVAHLQTMFSIPVSSVNDKKGRLIAGLHPTPAVCGIPKADSYLMIQKAEQHERRYYTGFLGPWNINDPKNNETQSSLFVNLRCAEMGKEEINIYVGGGLTSSSDPIDEYEETIHKSQTLLSIVENL